MPDPSPASAIPAAFLHQASWCDRLGSPFTATLLRALLPDLEAGAPLAAIIGDWPGNPAADLLPLRITGALHALMLSNQAPELTPLYPPNPVPDEATLRATLPAVLLAHADFIRAFIAAAPQTNEVARAAVLLGGFMQIAAATRLPLRLLEIGASAGLNLLWDQFHYQLGTASWGNAASPVRLAPSWHGNLPPLDAEVQVASRAGCDLAPINSADQADQLRLRAYVWPDQTERLERLDGALRLAAAAPPVVEQGNATDFLASHLADLPAGETTVIYHSIMWTYVAEADRAAITALVQDAARRATEATPVAWLRFELETPETNPALKLTLWPGATQHRLAVASPHGASVEWLAD